ncbi:MAG: PIN domain-containing protein [Synergistaceae bacterium]|jgi:predicted nucleic acid-binding protein|nr:PIN domain-containing protein [Synergistaceae bacterium]
MNSTPKYILDACALIAYLNDEPGADIVSSFLEKMENCFASLLLHKINLLEVYYGYYRERGKYLADEMLEDILSSDIQILGDISNDMLMEAGRFKGSYSLSLGDAILLAAASVSGSAVLTCDHHEFDVVEKEEMIAFEWIR